MQLNHQRRWTGAVLGLGLSALAAFAIVGCGSSSSSSGTSTASNGGSSDSGKKITMGFSQVGAESGWRTANTNSIKTAAADAGIDLKFADAQQKQENQIKAIKDFIAQGVDVIAFSPVVTTGWEPVLQEAKRAKIPVIVSDRRPDVPDDLYATFIGSDFVKEGNMAGEWLAKKTNGKAVIAEITGTPGSAPANDRAKGFDQAISKYPGMKVVFNQTGNFTRAEGKTVAEALLKSDVGKTITALYCHNDDMALGAVQAIKEAGKKPGKDIIIVSVDGLKDTFQAMVDGDTNCTVECNPLIGPLIMSTAKDILAGKKVDHRIVTPDKMYDQTQAAAELPNRKY
jgi:simple sugar transport system substrate-binding protein